MELACGDTELGQGLPRNARKALCPREASTEATPAGCQPPRTPPARHQGRGDSALPAATSAPLTPPTAAPATTGNMEESEKTPRHREPDTPKAHRGRADMAPRPDHVVPPRPGQPCLLLRSSQGPATATSPCRGDSSRPQNLAVPRTLTMVADGDGFSESEVNREARRRWRRLRRKRSLTSTPGLL